MAFNLVNSVNGRVGTLEMDEILKDTPIPVVPILDENYILPDTVEELRDYVRSEKSVLNDKIKEGIVFRKPDGSTSFKCVDPEYLMKYH